jgi:hypothetical protein
MRRLMRRFATTAAVLALLMLLLYPVGTTAATAFFTVFISDPIDPSNRARVDAGGSLNVRNVEEPGRSPRSPFQASVSGDIPDGVSGVGINLPDAPIGTRFVIRFVSASVTVPAGQRPISLSLTTTVNQSPVAHSFAPAFVGEAGTSHRFLMNSETMLFHDRASGAAQVFVQRNDGTGQAFARFAVSGYLLDGTAITCD